MRIVGANSSVSTLQRQFASETDQSTQPEAPHGAMVVLEPPHRTRSSPQPTRHPSAPFVAHLIATRMQAPQTRARRRAEPEEAISVYRSMTKPVTAKRGFATRI